MDKMLVEKHQNTSFQEAQRLLEQTHDEMIQLAGSFSEEELFTKGHYKCTYTTDMAAYFSSVTTSPLQAGPEDVEDAPKDVEDFVLMSLRLLVSFAVG